MLTVIIVIRGKVIREGEEEDMEIEKLEEKIRGRIGMRIKALETNESGKKKKINTEEEKRKGKRDVRKVRRGRSCNMNTREKEIRERGRMKKRENRWKWEQNRSKDRIRKKDKG